MADLCTLDGTPVSRLAFGTMQFGGKADERTSRDMFDAARDIGINHFDTAVGYCDGRSEGLTGAMVKPVRDSIFVATKVGYAGGANRANLTAQFDRSRKQSGLELVDLMYLHRFDDAAPLEDTFDLLAQWQEAGHIRHIGVSNYAAWQVMKAQAIANARGTRIAAIQPMYNLVKRQAEVELLPMAADQGIAVFPYSPLGGGLLTGKYARGDAGRLTEDDRYAARYAPEWMARTARDLTALAATMGHDPATLAVAWAAQHSSAPAPIISGSTLEQCAASFAAMNLRLSDADYAAISALSPTPAPATDRLEEI